MDVNITALFIPIVADLSPTSCHRQFALKLNSFGYDILIGTLFPLIEQIRESLLGEKVISGRDDFGIHNLELKISCSALFVWQPVCGGARTQQQQQRQRSRSQRHSGLTLSSLKTIKE